MEQQIHVYAIFDALQLFLVCVFALVTPVIQSNQHCLGIVLLQFFNKFSLLQSNSIGQYDCLAARISDVVDDVKHISSHSGLRSRKYDMIYRWWSSADVIVNVLEINVPFFVVRYVIAMRTGQLTAIGHLYHQYLVVNLICALL
jgi:hypothetical protein